VESLKFNSDQPYEIIFDTHAQKLTVQQDGKKIVHKLTDIPEVGLSSKKLHNFNSK
jgi:hypothetical protein